MNKPEKHVDFVNLFSLVWIMDGTAMQSASLVNNCSLTVHKSCCYYLPMVCETTFKLINIIKKWVNVTSQTVEPSSGL